MKHTSEITRYGEMYDGHPYSKIVKCPDGPFIKYSDYGDCVTEIKSLREANKVMREALEQLVHCKTINVKYSLEMDKAIRMARTALDTVAEQTTGGK